MTGDTVPFLPYGRQHIDDDDVAAVTAALRGEMLTGGPLVGDFEEALRGRVGAGFAVACANGTAALHLAMLALGIGPGDRVAVPAVTFLATANAARFVGAEVVFVDVDPETGLMGADHLLAALDRAAPESGAGPVRAVIPVHLNGQCIDLDAVCAVARARGLAVVEDACHAIGGGVATGDADRRVGACALSDMTVFSFHPVKTVAMGEGGAITTNDPQLAERLALLRNHGMTRDPATFQCPELALAADGTLNPWYYEMAEPGFNYRVTDVQCALGLSQLAKLERFVGRRGALVERYVQLLAPLAPLVRPVGRGTGAENARIAWHLAVALIDFAAAGVSRATIMQRLRQAGIGSQVHYLPVNRQPYYAQRYGVTALPGADAYYARALSLPLFPAMADSDVDRVVAALTATLTTGAEGEGR